MRGRWFWILLLGIAFALLIAALGRNGAELRGTDIGWLGYYVLLAAAVGSSVIVLFRRQFAQALKAALIWIALGLALMLAYTFRGDLSGVADRVMAELVPGRPVSRGAHLVEIVRGRNGDFQVAAQINGVRIPMVLDTGASAVVLTQEAAKAAGLPVEVLVYDVNVDTANGRTRAAAVTLDRVGVGDVIERAVPALIAQPGQLRSSLLGMSFLNRLESWEVRGDKVLMRGYP